MDPSTEILAVSFGKNLGNCPGNCPFIVRFLKISRKINEKAAGNTDFFFLGFSFDDFLYCFLTPSKFIESISIESGMNGGEI